jgi:presqualene diphosphate synthase
VSATATPASAEQGAAPALPAAGSSFYTAMRLLPRERREAMYAVYAFCRAVDDVADDGGTRAVRQVELDRWRADIDALYAGRPALRVRDLVEPVRRFGLKREDFQAVIDGMAMDAVEDIVAPDADTLDLYCDRVASAVGRLSVRIFGDSSRRADDVANALGRALQLTNILRDIAEDAERGRLYLPADLLDRHGITDHTPAAVLAHPALPEVCRNLASIALQHYADADSAIRDCDRRAMRPAVLMGAVYRHILDRLLKAGWRRPKERVGLSKVLKLWLILRYGLV